MTYLIFKAFWYLLAALAIGFFLGYRLRSADADEMEERLRRDLADRDRRLAEAMRSTPAPIGSASNAVAPEPESDPEPELEPEVSDVPASNPFAATAGSTPDDLKRIKGVGPKLEAELNALGITTFAQIAAFTDADLQRLDDALTAFKGRAVRDNWVGQATELMSG